MNQICTYFEIDTNIYIQTICRPGRTAVGPEAVPDFVYVQGEKLQLLISEFRVDMRQLNESLEFNQADLKRMFSVQLRDATREIARCVGQASNHVAKWLREQPLVNFKNRQYEKLVQLNVLDIITFV